MQSKHYDHEKVVKSLTKKLYSNIAQKHKGLTRIKMSIQAMAEPPPKVAKRRRVKPKA